MEREPPKIAIALNAIAGDSIVSPILFLGGTLYIENEIGRAAMGDAPDEVSA